MTEHEEAAQDSWFSTPESEPNPVMPEFAALAEAIADRLLAAADVDDFHDRLDLLTESRAVELVLADIGGSMMSPALLSRLRQHAAVADTDPPDVVLAVLGESHSDVITKIELLGQVGLTTLLSMVETYPFVPEYLPKVSMLKRAVVAGSISQLAIFFAIERKVPLVDWVAETLIQCWHRGVHAIVTLQASLGFAPAVDEILEEDRIDLAGLIEEYELANELMLDEMTALDAAAESSIVQSDE